MKLAKWILLCCCFVQTVFAQDIKDTIKVSRFNGGVIVHLGCGDGKRTVALRAGDNCIVQGLDTSTASVNAARKYISSRGIYGKVTAMEFDGGTLPYIDGMVNLLVVDKAFSVPTDEMMRVLCPNGTLCIKENGKWKKITKPWPDDIDEWTHYLHDPAGTMVGRDKVVGPPRRLQWVGGPKWLRNHEFMSSMHAMVSAGGRVFYIMDEGLRSHIFLPSHWTLIARDAFNGTVLWKRKIKDWQTHIWPMKSGPGHLPRRLVAVGDTVYVTLGFDEPVTAIDAATGETIRTYNGTKATEEIVLSDGVLYLLTDPDKKPLNFREETKIWGQAKNRANTTWGWTKERDNRVVVAVDADSGKMLWKYVTNVAPLTLTAGGKRLFLFNGDSIVALEPKSGKEAWVSEDLKINTKPTTGYTHRMVYSDGVVVLCHNQSVVAISADTGRLLWRGKLLSTGHNSPNDIFIINGLIWSANTGKPQKDGTEFQALDLATGEVKERFVAENFDVYFMHQRCYPGRATERYIMTSGTGTEFYELGSKRCDIHHYIRGSCIYGLMPCNGLLYKPPDSCACHYQSKMTHFCALAPAAEGKREAASDDEQRLQQGPAYGLPVEAVDGESDWPTYRRDAKRSGHTEADLPAELKQGWQADIGGKLSAPTVAGDKAFVAAVDQHTLYALDAGSGKVAWKYTAGGRVDSPPTIYKGMALFGSADGWVYCLRASDGELVWRYRVAPGDKQLVSYQQLESLWPVHGSVLVKDGTAYCLAGRNMFFDGGMRLLRLNASTGRKISETVLDEINPETGLNLQTRMPGKAMPVANPDILSCDGKYIYMGAQKFNMEGVRVDIDAPKDKEKVQVGEGRHLFCPTGFLDDNWFHRSYMMYGITGGEGHGEYTAPPNITPSGRLLVFDKDQVYGFRATVYENTMHPRPSHFLFSADRAVKPSSGQMGTEKKSKANPGLNYQWTLERPGLLANALVSAGKTLFLAGPPDVSDEEKAFGINMEQDSEITWALRAQDESWRGRQGALLWAVAADDGSKLAEYKLDALPVWDGMATANGKLFLALKNGKVLCWSRKEP